MVGSKIYLRIIFEKDHRNILYDYYTKFIHLAQLLLTSNYIAGLFHILLNIIANEYADSFQNHNNN